MRSDAKKLLFDVASGVEAIRTFTLGLTFVDYEGSHLVRSACERQFEIVGEAMARLRDTNPDVFDRIDDAYMIVAFRNRLIHGYDTVDTGIVWEVIQSRLPDLDTAVRRLIDETA